MSDLKRTCHSCGNEFEAKRTTAKFCSTKCRVAYMRSKHRVESDLSVAMETIFTLGQEIDDGTNAYSAAIQLREMRKTIDKYLPNLSSWWRCENCGAQEMAFIPSKSHCNCGDNARWILMAKKRVV